MIKTALWLLSFLPFLIQGLYSHSIAFVHIGNNLPIHLYSTIEQTRLFNEECSIFLIANQAAIQNANPSLRDMKITFIPCESLTPSKAHTDFITNPEQDWGFEGLWVYSSERFFYLEELMREHNLSDVFHIESDVLIYTNLEDLLPVFKKHYNGMLGAVFENDHRCVPSIMYISNLEPLKSLIDFYPNKVSGSQADMDIIADFNDRYHRIFIDFLPITIPEYGEDSPFEGTFIQSKKPELYSNNIEAFNAIFDGAAFGIYLAGWDSRWHDKHNPGTISKFSVVNPSVFVLDWKIDDRGRKVPVVSCKGKQLPLLNLHITNKSFIKQFLSVVKLDEYTARD